MELWWLGHGDSAGCSKGSTSIARVWLVTEDSDDEEEDDKCCDDKDDDDGVARWEYAGGISPLRTECRVVA